MSTEADVQPGAESVTDAPCVADRTDSTQHAAVGRITVSAARRFGARASALAGLVATAGMIGAMTVAEHTTPSVSHV